MKTNGNIYVKGDVIGFTRPRKLKSSDVLVDSVEAKGDVFFLSKKRTVKYPDILVHGNLYSKNDVVAFKR